MKTTPTTRSLLHLRRQGYLAEVCEKWIPKLNRRRDLFGVADIIAAHPGIGAIVLVQSTSVGNVSSRVRKSLAEPRLRTWLRAGGAFVVHGWNGPKLKERILTLDDCQGVPVVYKPKRAKPTRQGNLFPAIPAPLPRRKPSIRPKTPQNPADAANGLQTPPAAKLSTRYHPEITPTSSAQGVNHA